jgi:hypothetical protein
MSDQTEGRKFDAGKPDYTLLPWASVEEIVKVLDFGAKKYARDNWRHVDNAENRYLAAGPGDGSFASGTRRVLHPIPT